MNRKLKLSLDDLFVESFHVARPAAREGTVRAHESGEWVVSCGESCADTCDPCNWESRGQYSCAPTCDLSCAGCDPDPSTQAFTCDFTCGPCGDYSRGGGGGWDQNDDGLTC